MFRIRSFLRPGTRPAACPFRAVVPIPYTSPRTPNPSLKTLHLSSSSLSVSPHPPSSPSGHCVDLLLEEGRSGGRQGFRTATTPSRCTSHTAKDGLAKVLSFTPDVLALKSFSPRFSEFHPTQKNFSPTVESFCDWRPASPPPACLHLDRQEGNDVGMP